MSDESEPEPVEPVEDTSWVPRIPPPPGYRYQLSPEAFDFDIIKRSRSFKRYQAHAERLGLVRDVCRKELDDVDKDVITLEEYLNIEQKSPTWFRFRAAADGTASSVGKKIKGPTMYPTMEQISEAWEDMLNEAPFVVTHTMAGHMGWGVGYEDPALIHFAVDNKLSVAQVGTVHLPLSYILDLVPKYVPELSQHAHFLREHADSEAHLLVSPDGVVGLPDEGQYEEMPTELLGMLEIKCISPFHHMEDSRTDTLVWVDDMETRQWFHPGQIPFVYISQICLQAISGLHRLDMNDDHTMWFIRWSPIGFSEFSIDFGPLVKMGIVISLLYFRLKLRVTSMDCLPLVYTSEEDDLSHHLHECYHQVMDLMHHRYVSHKDLYPEFRTYQNCTQRHNFVVKRDT